LGRTESSSRRNCLLDPATECGINDLKRAFYENEWLPWRRGAKLFFNATLSLSEHPKRHLNGGPLGVMSTTEHPVLTIGHSTHSAETFLGLLRQHHVEAVADVRSSPFSRFNPQFNR